MSFQLANELFEKTKTFPPKEQFSLTDQILRIFFSFF
ncbi:MAG: four helix bundle protein [Candidatus Omnitrophica bacterium]|nr:four helix bundle protein [Candidatus Omnitrophota bacterium]